MSYLQNLELSHVFKLIQPYVLQAEPSYSSSVEPGQTTERQPLGTHEGLCSLLSLGSACVRSVNTYS